jgi:hypothetical protein
VHHPRVRQGVAGPPLLADVKAASPFAVVHVPQRRTTLADGTRTPVRAEAVSGGEHRSAIPHRGPAVPTYPLSGRLLRSLVFGLQIASTPMATSDTQVEGDRRGNRRGPDN